MPKKTTTRHGDLVQAAKQLEETLATYDRYASELVELKLNTQRNVTRAMEVIVRISELETPLATAVAGLVQGVALVRDRQQGQAASVEKMSGVVLERKEVLQTLLAELGALTGDLKVVRDSLSGDVVTATAPQLDLTALTAQIVELGERARVLALRAKEHDFPELSAQGHALRDQLMALAKKTGGFAPRPT